MTISFSRATPRERKVALEQRWADLKLKREPWLKWWKEVSDFISPFSGRFSVNDHLQDRNFDFIFNDEGGYCLDILVSGLASGATSSVKPWFRLQTSNPSFDYDYDAQIYLNDTQRLLLKIFHKSNTYTALHQVYTEMALYGVSADLIYDDFYNVISHHVLPAGTYCLASNDKGIVDTLYREFQLTTAQAVKFFGLKNLSRDINQAYENGNLEEYWTFIHAIEPREDRYIGSKLATEKPFASYYFEEGTSGVNFARESGFDYFPALCPRWDVQAGETYGLSPSIKALPDIKQLQNLTLRKEELVEMYTKPPVQAPLQARQQGISLDAGAINFIPQTGGDTQIKPIVNSVGDLNAITNDIEQVKENIRNKYYVQLFLMLQQNASTRKTAYEAQGLQQEKMLVLGPVVERMNREIAGDLIRITYAKCAEADILPDAPQSLDGQGLELEFTSVLAQSQRAANINSVDRFISFIQAVMPTNPDAGDRIDIDGLVDVYSDSMAVDPHILRSKQDADEIRRQRAQAQQQAIQAEQALQMGQTQNQLAQAQKAGADASLATQELQRLGTGAI